MENSSQRTAGPRRPPFARTSKSRKWRSGASTPTTSRSGSAWQKRPEPPRRARPLPQASRHHVQSLVDVHSLPDPAISKLISATPSLGYTYLGGLPPYYPFVPNVYLEIPPRGLAKVLSSIYFTNQLVNMSVTIPTRTQTERAEQARARILDAAVSEFSENGLAGARTEQIAEAAGVNKALLYYYFKSKDALYAAALESVAQRVVASSLAAMTSDRSAGEQVVHFALNHFDRIHSQQAFQKMMQQEMMRLHRGEENALTPIVEKVFRPMMMRLRDLFAEGKRTGEL